MNTPLLDVDS